MKFENICKGFHTLFLIEGHEKWIEEIYSKLPNKIKKLVDRKHLIVGYSPKNYPDKDEVAYFIKPNLIEFNTNYFSFLIRKEFFIGALVHELGHFYADNLNPLLKFILLEKCDSEMLANYLACKMGFGKEIKVVEESLK